MAIEVEGDAANRKHTRDPAGVRTILDALGSPSAWTAGGMPRCKPKLWGRLVHPSAEGGATFLFCSSSTPGYLSLPGQGSFRLPEEASQALYRATTRLELPNAGSIAPVVVTDHLDSVLVRATIALGSRPTTGLRSVTLARGHRLEPDATRDDGSPIGRSFALSEDQASELAAALALSGFFHRASVHVNPATDPPGDPPEGRTVGVPPQPDAPAGWVSVTVTAEGWHHTWQEANAPAIFAHTLSHLGRAGLDADAAAALGELPPQLK